MQVKVSVVLFVAESGQHLAAAVLRNDTLRDVLDNLQQLSPQRRFQLQQGTDVLLRHHDHRIGSESRDRRTEGQHLVRLGHYLDVNHPRNHFSAVPIRLTHNATLRTTTSGKPRQTWTKCCGKSPDSTCHAKRPGADHRLTDKPTSLAWDSEIRHHFVGASEAVEVVSLACLAESASLVLSIGKARMWNERIVSGEVDVFVAWTEGAAEQPLLVVHGGPDWDHSYLRQPLDRFAGARRLLLPDLRGCGRSARGLPPEAYSPDAVVRDLLAVLDAFDVRDRKSVV